MAVKITEECIGCGACNDVCPVSALSLGDDGLCVVDEDACLECGACVAECPTEAIKL